MGHSIVVMSDDIPITEPIYIPIAVASRLVRVERMGDWLLLCFGLDTVDQSGRPVVEITAKVMRPEKDMMGADCIIAMSKRGEPSKGAMN